MKKWPKMGRARRENRTAEILILTGLIEWISFMKKSGVFRRCCIVLVLRAFRVSYFLPSKILFQSVTTFPAPLREMLMYLEFHPDLFKLSFSECSVIHLLHIYRGPTRMSPEHQYHRNPWNGCLQLSLQKIGLTRWNLSSEFKNFLITPIEH